MASGCCRCSVPVGRGEGAGRDAAPEGERQAGPRRRSEDTVRGYDGGARRRPGHEGYLIDESASERAAGGSAIVPGVREEALPRELANQGEGLAGTPHGEAADRYDVPGQGLQTQRGGDDDAGQPVAAAGQIEQSGRGVGRESHDTEGGMKQRQVQHRVDEGAFPHRVLAMDIGCDAAADGDGGVAGLDRQAESLARCHGEDIAQRDARLHLDDPRGRVEPEDAIEAAHVLHDAAGSEARRGIGVPTAAGDAGSAIRVAGVDEAVSIGSLAQAGRRHASVERDERRGHRPGHRGARSIRDGRHVMPVPLQPA